MLSSITHIWTGRLVKKIAAHPLQLFLRRASIGEVTFPIVIRGPVIGHAESREQ
jgi:hypothetical protein